MNKNQNEFRFWLAERCHKIRDYDWIQKLVSNYNFSNAEIDYLKKKVIYK